MPDTIALHVFDERLHEALDPNPAIEKLADGFTFIEGPIWHPDEHWLVFSDIPESRQYRWTPVEGISLHRWPSNMANGNCFDGEGRILTCEHGTSSVVRLENEGKVLTPLATHFGDKRLNSPNDIVVDRAGRIYFTDPPFGRQDHALGVGYPRQAELDFAGVYRLDPDGSLHLLADDFEGPNGLCLSLDESALFVSDTFRFHIRRFDLDGEGRASGGDVWAPVDADFTDPTAGKKWVPDGLKSDVEGRLYSSGPGGIHVIHPDATPLGVMLMPEKSANFCFGMAGRDHLITTSSTGLYSVATKTSGPPII